MGLGEASLAVELIKSCHTGLDPISSGLLKAVLSEEFFLNFMSPRNICILPADC